ncbi:hypothetical protein SpCBS45565_g02856 [Spizellomyces sp. 'palustris']|nr:hypothetical protein SpCBS45565_g02856 [Spizellomyces sp. 'palustris']
MLPSVLARTLTPTSSPPRASNTTPRPAGVNDMSSQHTDQAWLEDAGTRLVQGAVTVNSRVFSFVREFQSQMYREVEVAESTSRFRLEKEVPRSDDRVSENAEQGVDGNKGTKKREALNGAELLTLISHTITNVFVTLAILLKQSPIPSTLTQILDHTLDFFRILDAEYAIQQKLVVWGQALVRFQVWISGVFAMAVLRAVVAYQKTPPYQRPQSRDPTPISPSESPRPTQEPLPPSPTIQSTTTTVALRTRLSNLIDLSLTPSPTQTIKLSVGGIPFTTTRATLCADPGSLLAQLFGNSSKGRIKCSMADGAYFIDRDGTQFRHILNWLRGVDTITQIEDKQSLRELQTEGEYYEIRGLVELISDLLIADEQSHQHDASSSSIMKAGKAGLEKTRTKMRSYLPSSIQTLL